MDRISKKLNIVGDCWLYTGSVNTDGYPSLTRKGYRGIGPGNVKGHRYVYEMTKGEIPDGQVVRHTCDNLLCLNPEHLILGTQLENIKDRSDRGRTSNHVSQEQADKALELRAQGMSQLKAAKIVGCSQMFISKLERGLISRFKCN